MYEQILVAVDLNDETGWRQPLVAAAEHARKFGAGLTVLTVVREVEALVQPRSHRSDMSSSSPTSKTNSPPGFAK